MANRKPIVIVSGKKQLLKSGDDLDIGSNKIVNVTDPTAAQDAATKAYVDLMHSVPGRTSGLYYQGGVTGTNSNGPITLNTLYAIPFNVGKSQSFDRIAVAAQATASSFIRLGIYADDGGSRPGALLYGSAQLSGASSGLVADTINQTLSGLVWLAAVGQSVAPSIMRMLTILWLPSIGVANPFTTGVGQAYSQTGASGTLPSPWGSTFTPVVAANTIPMIFLRKT